MRMPVADRRAALIRAALRVISRDGVADASTRAITTEAGMSLASFHYAFASRSELLAQLIDVVIADEKTVTERVLTTSDSLEPLIRDGFKAYLSLLTADPDHEQAMLELTFYALRTDGMHHTAARQYDAYLDLAAGLMSRAAKQTGCRWTIPLDVVARLVVTVTDGMTTTWLADRDTEATTAVAEGAAAWLAQLAEADDS